MEFAAEDIPEGETPQETDKRKRTRSDIKVLSRGAVPQGCGTTPSAGLETSANRNAAQDGEGTDFQELYRNLSPYIWRALRRFGVAERDVDDVLQDVFIVVHRKLPEFEGRSTVRSFVYGIALRVASDYRRKAYHRREKVSDRPPERSVEPNQIHIAEQRRSRTLLDSLLGCLNEQKRSVFVLYEIEQLSMEEVARAVGCTTATAYARLAAARRKLKRALRKKQIRGEVGDTFLERGERKGGRP